MNDTRRVLIVGRSPSVLLKAVELLRAEGYAADATNQFDQVLDDYDADTLDVLVFGGMVPPETKRSLREAVTARNPRVTVLQGLAGIPGVIAAQVRALTADPAGTAAAYDSATRTLHLTLPAPAPVAVEAWWGTSFVPPEPESTSMTVYAAQLDAGRHTVPLPDEVPDTASFAAVTVGPALHVLTLGAMPRAVTALTPSSAADRRLPEAARVSTKGDAR
jgi:hypothetical protein